jgi:DNA primase
MAYAPQLLDEIRHRLSLANVVGKYVRLQKHGRDFTGLCPFHKEKTPSFNVVEDKEFYHCFGCGAHGDVIGFTMRIENVGFREAVETLARQAGVELPKESAQPTAEIERRATLHQACAAAADLFEAQLWSADGKVGLDYLRKRGLSDDLIRRFRLGWAPSARNFLRDHLGKLYPEELLIAAGLVHKGDRGTYDFFRGRVIFPIFDRAGRAVAFGGRVLDDGQPKYLNSPDTEIFSKRRMLFGFHLARQVFSKETPPIVVEGYIDVVTLHGAGFASAVAPLGTSLTEDQLAELWKASDRPVICFDGDAAGSRAAARTLDHALATVTANKSLLFVTLEDGEDPDSLIRSFGRGAFEEAMWRGQETSEFLWRLAIKGERPKTAERLAIARQFLDEKIRLIADRNVQQSYRTIFTSRLWEIYREQRPVRGKKKSSFQDLSLEGPTRDINPRLTKNKVCLLLLATAINHPYLLEHYIDHFSDLKPKTDGFVNIHQDIASAVSEAPGIDGSKLLDYLWFDRGHSKTLLSIFNSAIYRCTLTSHPHAGAPEAELGWEALFNRLLVDELERERDEQERALVEDFTQKNSDLLILRAQTYQFHHREEHLMSRERASVSVRLSWHPPEKAMASEVEAKPEVTRERTSVEA